MNTIDARGLACPQPVMMTKAEVDRGAIQIAVLVDNAVAVANVTRFLESAGFEVDGTEGDGSEYCVVARRVGEPVATPAPVTAAASNAGGSRAFLITSDTIGAESDGLGSLLMSAWLGTIKSSTPRPETIALMNRGVRLALPGGAADTLRELADAGVRVLVCGTCTKHFGITDDIAVGTVSNMFEITEAVYGADKPISVR